MARIAIRKPCGRKHLRISSVRIITAVSCLLFGAAVWQLGPHSSANQIAHAQTPKPTTPPQLQPVSVSTAVRPSIPDRQLIAGPGTELYIAKRGESIPTVAHRYPGRTRYLTSAELSGAIRAANHKSESSNILK